MTNGSAKRTKRYVPQKNSVAYALLITLYRGIENGIEFMRKQELIDAAEASGLSRVPIMPEKGKGIPTSVGSSAKEWYSGWSCMKTLLTKGLVLKLSCPAKYKLTEEGQEAARQCLMRSGLAAPLGNVSKAKGLSIVDVNISQQNLSHPESVTDMTLLSSSSSEENSIDVPRECIDKSCPMPKSSSAGVKESLKALPMPPLSFGERFEDAYEVVLLLDDREQLASQILRSRSIIESVVSESKIKVEVRRLPVGDGIWIARHNYIKTEYVLDFIVERKNVDDLRCSIRDNRYRDQKLRLLIGFVKKKPTYRVMFAMDLTGCAISYYNISLLFDILGDVSAAPNRVLLLCLFAQHIKQRCGLKKLIYLVEGDPNSCEAAESIKTSCFTTEILEGFDVQRTGNLTETLRKFGYLTEAIFKYYKELFEEQRKPAGVCLTFGEFNKRCQHLDKMTVSDVFAIQLMQVPQVTEEVAIAVLDLYPTPFSLAHEYSLLEGDIHAQEEMLRIQTNNVVNAAASKNIFHFVWSN